MPEDNTLLKTVYMNKLVYPFLFFFSLCQITLQAKSHDIIIPAVVYSPVDFEQEVRASFVFNPNRPCLVKRTEGKNVNMLINMKHLSPDYQLLPFEDQTGEMADVMKAMERTDSVFLLYMDESEKAWESYRNPRFATYYGFIENGAFRFGNLRTHTLYSSFREFVNAEFGSYTRFVEGRLKNIKRGMEFPQVENYYYGDLTVDEAIDVLRDDYQFNKNKMESIGKEKVIDMFFSFIGRKLSLTDHQKEKMKLHLLRNNLNFEDWQALGWVLTDQELALAKSMITEQQHLCSRCYQLLAKTVPNTDDAGRYLTTDDVLQAVIHQVFK